MSFRDEVREFYKPFYDDGDEAHKIDHADSVCDLALRLNEDYDERLVILASYIHDIFNATDRKNHHKLAYEYVLRAEDKFLQSLSQDELKLIAHGVLEHRGSFKGEFYSLFSEIISGADRGLSNLEEVIIRSCKYNNGDAKEVLAHIKDKYATGGYGNYPPLIQKKFAKELSEFKRQCDELTLDYVIKVCQEAKLLKK